MTQDAKTFEDIQAASSLVRIPRIIIGKQIFENGINKEINMKFTIVATVGSVG